ncbi:xylulokinase [Fulvivirga lutimaris]|uniref:xylulokinase n=1 Tax=Fulvivirga lutimaris TaxID=1819566 RepID=UPI0012BBBBBD|nr:FGGY family carbohydrate kinase [Fulvivirga lutimaris]MTI41281.1 carbohydrate kinase [Fulvivirga lutimaris]
MLLIGYDIGTSSIKAALVDSTSKKVLGSAHYPEREMSIISEKVGWAEQNPQDWWQNLQTVTDKLFEQTGANRSDVQAIGITYQMHGLVIVDREGEVIRPSIIWCDSRAVEIGDEAFKEIGKDKCLQSMLNSPGNFTASKLKWVKENEPANYEKVKHVFLPGDYIAYKFTGEASTTATGLSEGILWDFKSNELNKTLVDYYGFDQDLIPKINPAFSDQGTILPEMAEKFGFDKRAIVAYRAGDQPNNAFSLNVVNPGEIAATAGTSGVVYGVVDQLSFDTLNRVNTFAHINHSAEARRLGILLCINGTGSAYGWLRNQLAPNSSYVDLESEASSIAVGSDGLSFLPFGNGAERMLENRLVGAHFNNLQFNQHTKSHLIRACLEGVAFSFVYGMACLKESGVTPEVIKADGSNMFQSAIFSQTIATLTGTEIQLKKTSGAVGAALGAGVGAGHFANLQEAFFEEKIQNVYKSGSNDKSALEDAYENWLNELENKLK